MTVMLCTIFIAKKKYQYFFRQILWKNDCQKGIEKRLKYNNFPWILYFAYYGYPHLSCPNVKRINVLLSRARDFLKALFSIPIRVGLEKTHMIESCQKQIFLVHYSRKKPNELNTSKHATLRCTLYFLVKRWRVFCYLYHQRAVSYG